MNEKVKSLGRDITKTQVSWGTQTLVRFEQELLS